jgi:hypothetical protein
MTRLRRKLAAVALVMASFIAAIGGNSQAATPLDQAGIPTVTNDAGRIVNARALVGKHCTMDGKLFDRACTPGVVSDRVTQENIKTTICVKGYTAKVRPNAVASARKRAYAAYGLIPTTGDEYDHIIPLELGGANDARNLAPQVKVNSTAKNTVENRLKRAVCAGKMTLETAQIAIATDWTSA